MCECGLIEWELPMIRHDLSPFYNNVGASMTESDLDFVSISCEKVYIFFLLETAKPEYTKENSPYYMLYLPRETRSQDQILETETEVGSGERRDGFLCQLQRKRDMAEERRKAELISLLEAVLPDSEKQALPEYTESLPGTWDRQSRELTIQKHYSICQLERKIVNLNTLQYEYRPAYYEEITCRDRYREGGGNEVCSSLGFTCFQWNKTLHVTRRRFSSDCWETKTMVIPAGCECMWPTHKLGDIKLHL